ncbi:nitrate transporter [Microcoleus sp. FACHB-672]|uniref:nitrate transporter n=1 Tax=Microcoleus sp. FACHB-672 TaxID=2692825 RepID=UPI001681EE02|nr:nitrate transporter [Microcoleus sp. FACHB-672]MBD2043208.1 nitrate transporter [Microcoleus sp. FACHB-672]
MSLAILASVQLETQWRLPSAILASLQLLFWGYIPAVILGVPIAILIGKNRLSYHIFRRLFQIPGTIPSIVLLPLALLAFKQKQVAIAFISFISAILQIIIHTAMGVRQFQQNSNNLGVSYIFTGLRLGIRVAWFAVIAAEMLAGTKGIGFSIWEAYKLNKVSDLIVAILYLSITSFLLDQLLELGGYVASQLFPEEEKEDSGD